MVEADEIWSTAEVAAFLGVAESTVRSWVANGLPRADPIPQPLPGFDEQRRRRYSAAEIRAWNARRPGRGARTDLGPVGDQVADMAALILDLADELASVHVPRDRIRAEWARMYPEHNRPMGDSRGSALKRQVLNHITQLERRGLIRREGHTAVVVCDRDALAEAAGHVPGTA